MSSPLQVRLLGELELVRGTDRIAITAGRLRALLALLALSAGRSVTSERLVGELWAEQLPSNPRRSLHTYVNRLRNLVGAETIATDPYGYTLRLDPDQVDVLRFGRLLADARQAADRTTERLALEAALLLWRDEPFGGIDAPVLQQVERPRLVEAFLTASERRIDLDVEHGQLDGPIEELAELTGRYPLRESLWVRQLRLLDRSGRRAEALERYEQVRRLIADQLGSDPGAPLQTVHAALLADPTTDPTPEPTPAVIPRQLPPDLRIFAGRLDVLQALDSRLDGAAGATLRC
ncbi:AfsR/SARP family transcriptional regulator [Microlunatus soli]|uniref:DNA-binding transcriptional activator of the SARP family n=1 Tax=Microlunatus soli TaxID=630515 RepID=A0A1H1Z7N7_9ACTN|nr:AfsR/SARP family transcriptional regulator [Microlunatus soli]SDT29579.1 DNA-binding transcriptional activator of the SARP family [Microlunatus soli]